jgi:hypothetical protein
MLNQDTPFSGLFENRLQRPGLEHAGAGGGQRAVVLRPYVLDALGRLRAKFIYGRNLIEFSVDHESKY